jgi:hypothetical protein
MPEPSSPDETWALREEIRRLRQSLSELTPPLEILLKRRGFRIYKKEPSDDLLLPAETFIGDFYERMKKYSFRLFLREIIKHQPLFTAEQVARYATLEVTREYLKYMGEAGIVKKTPDGFSLSLGRIKSFGETLEWFIAEIFKTEFAAEAVWGIRFKRPKVGGDYDLIAKVDGSILYMEVKSSPPKQIYQTEISAFFDRVSDLLPEIYVFFVDTELRMKDKVVLMFGEELKKRHAKPPKVTRIQKELFHIWDKMFIINAKDSIPANIEKVLSWYFRRNQ